MFIFDTHTNKLIVTISGFFKQDEALAFIKEYNDTLKNINPNLTELVLDGKDLEVSSQEMLPILEQCIQMYLKDGFKKIYVVEFNSPIVMTQIKRLGDRLEFFKNVEMIKSVNDIL